MKSKFLKIGSIILASVIVLSVVGVLVFNSSALRYNYAINLMEKGEYYTAYNVLYPLGDYKDNLEIMKDYTHKHTLETETYDGNEDKNTYAYYESGSLKSKSFYGTDGTKYEYEYAYDDENRLIKEVQIQTDASGKVDNRTTLYEYNEKGYKIKETVSDTAISDYMTTTTLYEYDENGRMIKEYDEEFPDFTTNYIYDENGNLLKCVRSGETVLEYSYDEKGNLIQEKYCDEIMRQYDYAYDKNNNLTKIDDNGSIRECIYDDNGNPIKFIYGEDEFVTIEYDSNGNIIKMTNNIVTNQPLFTIRKMKYSATFDYTMYDIGQKESEYESDIWAFVEPKTTTEYTYDKNGNEIKKVLTYTNGDVRTTESTYNEMGLMIKSVTTYPDGTQSLTEYEYDAYENPLKTKVYDVDGNLYATTKYSGYVGIYNK